MHSKNESGKARLRYLSFALDALRQSHPLLNLRRRPDGGNWWTSAGPAMQDAQVKILW